MVKISPLPIYMAVSSGVSIFAFMVKISTLLIIMAVSSGVSIFAFMVKKAIANYYGCQ